MFITQLQSVVLVLLASRENLLGSALADDAILAFWSTHNYRHDAALKVEWDLVDLRVLREFARGVAIGVREDRAIQEILQAGLEVAVHVRQRENALVLLQHNVAVFFQNDVVHRQRAGLVGTQHVHRPEVLDRVDALDDDLLAAHRQSPFREANGHDHREHFRRQSHRHRNGEEKGLAPIALGQAVDDEHQGYHHHDETQHQPGETRDALVERGLRRLLRERRGHTAEVGVASRCHDDSRRGPALDAGPSNT